MRCIRNVPSVMELTIITLMLKKIRLHRLGLIMISSIGTWVFASAAIQAIRSSRHARQKQRIAAKVLKLEW